MTTLRVLITCPPMLGMLDAFRPAFESRGCSITAPNVVQALNVADLERLLPQHDGWIIGDDPAGEDVLAAGRRGRLKAVVKWGVGVDNVDFEACRTLGIRAAHTPAVFGADVADLALSYLIALARESFVLDRGVRAGGWPKPRGVSLGGKTLGIVGLGDVGRHLAARALVCGMRVIAWEPALRADAPEGVSIAPWPQRLEAVDFLALTCSLNAGNRRMLNAETLRALKPGVRLVNVARGGLIDEAALAAALDCGRVHSAALDVFEAEPLPVGSPLRRFERCIFGSHNASNTTESVTRASERAMRLLFGFLEV